MPNIDRGRREKVSRHPAPLREGREKKGGGRADRVIQNNPILRQCPTDKTVDDDDLLCINPFVFFFYIEALLRNT